MIFDLINGQLGVITFIIWGISLVLAVSLHEFSHALTAFKLGDPTAKLFGRLTLNPLSHLDVFGTLALLLTGFGWGKPTPVNPTNFENPLRDSALVSLAGPASNIIFAALLALPIRMDLFWGIFLIPAIYLNIGLAVFNLIPIYPLDGFKIVNGILPENLVPAWMQTAKYGQALILGLIFLPNIIGVGSVISLLVAPITETVMKIVVGG